MPPDPGGAMGGRTLAGLRPKCGWRPRWGKPSGAGCWKASWGGSTKNWNGRCTPRAIDTLTAAGFEHYEVSNFARAGPSLPAQRSLLVRRELLCRRSRRRPLCRRPPRDEPPQHDHVSETGAGRAIAGGRERNAGRRTIGPASGWCLDCGGWRASSARHSRRRPATRSTRWSASRLARMVALGLAGRRRTPRASHARRAVRQRRDLAAFLAGVIRRQLSHGRRSRLRRLSLSPSRSLQIADARLAGSRPAAPASCGSCGRAPAPCRRPSDASRPRS